MSKSSPALLEWLYPLFVVLCGGWLAWHMPAFILDFFPPDRAGDIARITALHETKQVATGLPGLFTPYTDIMDWAALILLPVFFVLGCINVRRYNMEFEDFSVFDRIAMFIGRIVMVLILLLTIVMLYEVALRYIFSKPTLWANELTLWLACFVFIMSGMYTMQQRAHIRITMGYDSAARWLRRVFDIISVSAFIGFTIFLIYGSYKQIYLIKFQKWEMWGTAFDPPIPATIQPMIPIMMGLLALQMLMNLIADWNREPEVGSKIDLDEDDIEQMRKTFGEK